MESPKQGWWGGPANLENSIEITKKNFETFPKQGTSYYQQLQFFDVWVSLFSRGSFYFLLRKKLFHFIASTYQAISFSVIKFPPVRVGHLGPQEPLGILRESAGPRYCSSAGP